MPLWTTAAVADAVIVGADDMNKPEKASLRWPASVTLTAFVVVVHAPVLGGVSTLHVGVVPRRLVTLPRVRSRATGVLALHAPVVTVWPASFP